jgi:hypothetical protein
MPSGCGWTRTSPRIDDDIDKIDRKLGNEQFVAKAPPEVIEEAAGKAGRGAQAAELRCDMARATGKDSSVAPPPPADDPAPAIASPPPSPGVAYFLDGKGGIVSDEPPARARGFQLLVLPPDPSGCLDWLVHEFGKVTAEALLEVDPRPHCTIYDEGVLIALTTVPVADRKDLKNQREAAFWVEKSRVVAVTDMTVEDLIGATPGKATASAPTTPIHLITRVALRAADRLEPILDKLSDKADDLEEEVLRQPTDRTRVGLNMVRRAAINIRRTVLPQRDALTHARDLGGLLVHAAGPFAASRGSGLDEPHGGRDRQLHRARRAGARADHRSPGGAVEPGAADPRRGDDDLHATDADHRPHRHECRRYSVLSGALGVRCDHRRARADRRDRVPLVPIAQVALGGAAEQVIAADFFRHERLQRP